MSKQRQTRAAARKVRDKWKTKEWYTVLAPDLFGNVPVGETFADDPAKLVGRIASVSYQDITGDYKMSHIGLHFQIGAVRANDCLTIYRGHELTADYIRRLTRRKHSKMDGIYNLITKDGYQVRLKPLAITEKRIKASQQTGIRGRMADAAFSFAKENTLAGLTKAVLTGELQKHLFHHCKDIYPVKRIEIRKTQVIARVDGSEYLPVPPPAEHSYPEPEVPPGTEPEPPTESSEPVDRSALVAGAVVSTEGVVTRAEGSEAPEPEPSDEPAADDEGSDLGDEPDT